MCHDHGAMYVMGIALIVLNLGLAVVVAHIISALLAWCGAPVHVSVVLLWIVILATVQRYEHERQARIRMEKYMKR